MNPNEIDFVRQCISTDVHRFYKSPHWQAVRAAVLRADHYECQVCKQRGRYTRATTVHHVMHLLDHPELALESYYQDCAGVKHRQLISLCHACHEDAHGHRVKVQPEPITIERW